MPRQSNKGRTFPAEVLSPDEARKLLGACSRGAKALATGPCSYCATGPASGSEKRSNCVPSILTSTRAPFGSALGSGPKR